MPVTEINFTYHESNMSHGEKKHNSQLSCDYLLCLKVLCTCLAIFFPSVSMYFNQ